MKRFIFVQDSSSHWYKIPVQMIDEFCELAEDDDGWQDEKWLKFENMKLNHHISSYSFTDVKVSR